MNGHPHTIYIGAAFATGVLFTYGLQCFRRRTLIDDKAKDDSILPARQGPPVIVDGIEGCIGNTPLLRIKSLSDATGCEVLAKAEV